MNDADVKLEDVAGQIQLESTDASVEMADEIGQESRMSIAEDHPTTSDEDSDDSAAARAFDEVSAAKSADDVDAIVRRYPEVEALRAFGEEQKLRLTRSDS